MDRVNEYRFYELGLALSVLRTLDKNAPVGDHAYDFVIAHWELMGLLNSPIGIKFSRKIVEGLMESLNGLIPAQAGGAHKDGKELLDYHAAGLKTLLSELEAVLKAELESLATYAISQKGAYSTPDLIEHAENMIPGTTRTLLPSAVIKDVREAGRCLAFDLPTASGFHILRAVELVMIELWEQIKAGADKKPTNWGAYIAKFEASNIDPKITTMLRNLKDLYRNPNAHPEDTLDEDEATTLFALGVAAIQQMAAQFPASS